MNNNKTIIKKTPKDTNWYILDAKSKILGRLSTKTTHILTSKHCAHYLPSQESKLQIIIINAKQIQVTGNKNKQKTYKKHSGRPGGMKLEVFEKLQQRNPGKIIENAIKGMLPKNSLGRKLLKKVKIYDDNNHPHSNKNLIEVNLD